MVLGDGWCGRACLRTAAPDSEWLPGPVRDFDPLFERGEIAVVGEQAIPALAGELPGDLVNSF